MALRVLNNQDVCLVTEIPCIGNPLQRHQEASKCFYSGCHGLCSLSGPSSELGKVRTKRNISHVQTGRSGFGEQESLHGSYAEMPPKE